MASSMWDSLLGGESPYPLRVGNYCFTQSVKDGDVDKHEITQNNDCCKQCKNQPDFHGVSPGEIGKVLAEVTLAKGTDFLTPNPNDINPALLEYFRSIPSAGAKTKEILEHLLAYIGLFVDVFDAKVSAAGEALSDAVEAVVKATPLVTGGAGLTGGGPVEDKALKDALDAFLDLVIAKVPGLRTPAQRYDAALKRKVLRKRR